MLNKLIKTAAALGAKAVEYAESDEGQARLKQAADLASKAGSVSLEASKKGAAFTASTAQRTYQGLAGFGEARDVAQDAQTRYEQAVTDFGVQAQAVTDRLTTFEEAQKHVLSTSVTRFVDLYLRHKDKLNNSDVDLEVKLNLTPKDVAAFRAAQVSALEVAGGLGSAVIAGASVGATATMAATALGTASTGVAISGLSGAAAHSALLAWFGGGSLAAGGGGMAAGAAVLGGIFVAPAVLVAAMTAARQGEKRVTQAQSYAAEVDQAIAEMKLRVTSFHAAIRRIDEVQDVTQRLSQHLMNQVRHCEQLERNGQTNGADRDGFIRALFQAAVTCKSIKDIMKVPVVDEHFVVTEESARLTRSLRQTLGGAA